MVENMDRYVTYKINIRGKSIVCYNQHERAKIFVRFCYEGKVGVALRLDSTEFIYLAQIERISTRKYSIQHQVEYIY